MKKSLCLLISLLITLSVMPRAVLAEETLSFTDSAGRTVKVPKDIRRIAPSGPLAQMALMALAPERFVGLSSAMDRDAEKYLKPLAQLPVIGLLYGTKGELNLEELLRLDPQVIIDIGDAKPSVKDDMDALQAQLGIPCVHIDMRLKDAGHAYRMLGELLDAREKAETIALYCELVYKRAESIALQVADKKVRLLYCLGEDGLNVLAKGSYHAEVLDLAADNAAVIDSPASKGTGNEADMEQLFLWDPDFIVFAPDSAYPAAASDPLWQELKAVRQGNYVQTPCGPYNWMGFPASVQRFLGLLWLQKLLYPQEARYDLQAEVTVYYKLFYGHELTPAQYDALMRCALTRKP